MLRTADWMWLTPSRIEMGCRTAQIGDPRAGKEGSPGSLEAWPGGKRAKPSAWGKLWWGEAQQGWNIRQDPCYFTFSMGGYLPCEFASDSKMYQKRFRRRMIREAAGRYSSAFSWTFWIWVYFLFFANIVGKSLWFMGKSWKIHIRCIDVYTFRTFHGQIGSPMDCDSIPGEDALVLLETAMEQIGKFFKENKHLGWKKSQPAKNWMVGPVVSQSLSWLNTLQVWDCESIGTLCRFMLFNTGFTA